MPRYALQMQFLGTDFCGSQRQSNGPSAQGEVERALKVYFRQEITLTMASRLDAGVHARAMIAHLDLEEGDLNEHLVCRHLGGILAPSIGITRFVPVSANFHARRDALKRIYVYKLRAFSPKFPLDESQVAYIPEQIDLDHLNLLASELLGQHDFTGLSVQYNYPTTPFCTIFEAHWLRGPDGTYVFTISADHYLYRMVRRIIGTQIGVVSGKISIHSQKDALQYQDRSLAGPCAPAKGLCLEAITYSPDPFS